MSKRLSNPCAEWAEQLTQASFQSPPGDMSAELKAHLSICPACAAAHAEYRYTAAALHRAPAPEPLPGLPAHLLRVWAAEKQRHAPVPATRIKEVFMQATEYERNPVPPPTPPARWQRFGRRASAAISAIAAVLVIAIVTLALFASHTSGKPASNGTPQTGSQTGNQTWQPLPHLSNLDLNHQFTLLAPSDPRVVYQVVLTNQGTRVSLRRSDDQGATWKNVAAPPGATTTLELFISPANAQHVLAINIMEDCPPSQAAAASPIAPLSSGNACEAFYFSSNGGASWTPVTLPTHDPSHRFPLRTFFAQENRIYAVSSHELVESRDDGATWHFADQGLVAAGHCLARAAAPRTSATLFATVYSDCSGQTSSSESAAVWRSDNGGAQWTQVGSIPATSASFLLAVAGSGQAQPVLIDGGAPPFLDSMRFSRDNGKTWQPIPTLDGRMLANPLQLGVLRDGSILKQTTNGFSAWKAGDAAWHKVAPALAGMVEGSLVASDASGKETLYVEVIATDRQSLSFYRITLA